MESQIQKIKYYHIDKIKEKNLMDYILSSNYDGIKELINYINHDKNINYNHPKIKWEELEALLYKYPELKRYILDLMIEHAEKANRQNNMYIPIIQNHREPSRNPIRVPVAQVPVAPVPVAQAPVAQALKQLTTADILLSEDELKHDQKGQDHHREEEFCVICSENLSRCVVLPCKHRCICAKCSRGICFNDINQQNMKNINDVTCPICRKNITSFMTIF